MKLRNKMNKCELSWEMGAGCNALTRDHGCLFSGPYRQNQANQNFWIHHPSQSGSPGPGGRPAHQQPRAPVSWHGYPRAWAAQTSLGAHSTAKGPSACTPLHVGICFALPFRRRKGHLVSSGLFNNLTLPVTCWDRSELCFLLFCPSIPWILASDLREKSDSRRGLASRVISV